MTNLRLTVPFLWVADMAASLRFYVEGLGFTQTRAWVPHDVVEWCWLERDGVALMLQQYREGRVPADTRGVGISLCYQCDDALALYREFIGRGLAPKRPFVGNGLWVVMISDADGYRLEFASLADLPEETEYDAAQHDKKVI